MVTLRSSPVHRHSCRHTRVKTLPSVNVLAYSTLMLPVNMTHQNVQFSPMNGYSTNYTKLSVISLFVIIITIVDYYRYDITSIESR